MSRVLLAIDLPDLMMAAQADQGRQCNFGRVGLVVKHRLAKHGLSNRDAIQAAHQFTLDPASYHNQFTQLVSPNKNDEGTWIYQDAYIHMAQLDAGKTRNYSLKNLQNGAYVMLISGELLADDTQLEARDAYSIFDTDQLTFSTHTNAHFIVIEVPMNL